MINWCGAIAGSPKTHSNRWVSFLDVGKTLTNSDQKQFQLQVGHWNIDTNCVPVSYPVTWHGHSHSTLSHSTHRQRFCLRSLRCRALSCLSSRCWADTTHFEVPSVSSNQVPRDGNSDLHVNVCVYTSKLYEDVKMIYHYSLWLMIIYNYIIHTYKHIYIYIYISSQVAELSLSKRVHDVGDFRWSFWWIFRPSDAYVGLPHIFHLTLL